MNILFALLTACTSFAYIPEYSLIASRTADQHGKGSYLIEQDVNYRKEGETYTVHETWLVNNENSMRVTLEGRGPLKGLVQGTYVYGGDRKFFIDQTRGNGALVQRLTDDWLEPFFYFRNSKWFRNRLVALKVTPSESLHDRAPLNSEGDPQYTPPAFVHLSRAGGEVAWALGLPASTGNHPTMWVEQDQFVVTKYHGADNVIMKAGDYNKYDDGFWFPRSRSYTFGNYTVEVQTQQVKNLGKLRPDDPRFRASGLNAQRDAVRLPDPEALKEFYARFR
jgi:hypothetical protein